MMEPKPRKVSLFLDPKKKVWVYTTTNGETANYRRLHLLFGRDVIQLITTYVQEEEKKGGLSSE